MNEVEIEKMATTLKLFGDKTRLTILALLHEGECCVCEFVELLQMSQPAISQHIRKLKDAKLVTETRRGQWIFYSMNKDNELYPVVLSILAFLPKQEEKLLQLEKLGKRISCD